MDPKYSRAKHNYGLTSEIFVNRPEDETIAVSGMGDQSDRWTRTFTRRAAHQLWFQLTRLLFPEKSPQVTGMAMTAPLSMPSPSVTIHVEIVFNPDIHLYDILGWDGEDGWWFRVDEQNARNLWTALDLALYPAGWSGPVTTRHRIS
jgi:hypothetical protein